MDFHKSAFFQRLSAYTRPHLFICQTDATPAFSSLSSPYALQKTSSHLNPTDAPTAVTVPCTRRSAVSILISYPASSTATQDSPTEIKREVGTNRQAQNDSTQHQSPHILFIQRAINPRDRWSGHISFPGGKVEPSDASDYDACLRETVEEVGIDLTQWKCVARLDDRLITAPNHPLPWSVLCCFVFVTQQPIQDIVMQLEPSEVARVEWIPLSFFLGPEDGHGRSQHHATELQWSGFNFPLSKHVTSPRQKWTAAIFDALFGRYKINGIVLPQFADVPETPGIKDPEKTPKEGQVLWGLTLWMTSDLIRIGCPRHPGFLQRTGPYYSSPDLSLFVKLFSRSNPRTMLQREGLWGQSYSWVIKSAMGTSLIARVFLTIGVIYWFKSRLLK